jgi:hypothetical protein
MPTCAFLVMIILTEKMRTEYGLLVYLMQDACCGAVSSMLNYNIKRPIKVI